jgi:L-threonylcarbamoyladenylate synthase
VSQRPRVAPIVRGGSAVERASDTLGSGGLVILPTDTVYGVGASVSRPDAVGRLYVAKGRPLDRPIPVLVSSTEAARRLALKIEPAAATLMRSFWPGPLTVVLPAVEWLPREIVGDTGMVGLRMPDHAIALEIIHRSGGALAVTSANRSDEPETRTASDAARAIGDSVDLIVDGGVAPGGVPSTVVRVSGGEVTILRRGAVSEAEIRHGIALSAGNSSAER